MVGYHGFVSRSSIHRQSGMNASITQTGLAKAPARCGTAVSVDITRSSARIAAAVSAKSVSSGERSVIPARKPGEFGRRLAYL